MSVFDLPVCAEETLEYQAYVNNKSLYSSTLQKLPTPKFVIFYNGTEDLEECTELRLSDAYENLEDFLRENRAEVEMVSILEYDKDFEEKKLREAEYEAGREEGARFGLAEGIVETGCAYNVPEPDILARLQEKLDIPLRKAQEYFAMYSK